MGVGVASTARGMQSLQRLLNAVEAGSGCSFVLIPPSDSVDLSALSASIPLTIQQVEGDQQISSNTVYVVPPHRVAEIRNGTLEVFPREDAGRGVTSIDHFLNSLAENQGSRSVGVILNGPGSDGLPGLKAIREAGGLTFAESVETTAEDGHKTNSGIADHVLSPEQIAHELTQYLQHLASVSSSRSRQHLEETINASIPEIAEHLLQVTGHNFQHYKTSTLVRRIQRRMQVLKLPDIESYIGFLSDNGDEARTLFRELLIGVTSFFRDPQAFAALAEKVLPKLFQSDASQDRIRIWVPGCATGEEAYTLAMLCREEMDRHRSPREVQIFASDINHDALQHARQGAYSATIQQDLMPERLKRFFEKRGKRYHASKEIRELILFSPHNLISDPPFSRQDLISCRNLLIYLGPHLQKKLVPLFHYALRPSGYLFLGPSESVAAHGELFRGVDSKHRISQRKSTAVNSTATVTHSQQPVAGLRMNRAPADVQETDTMQVMQRIVLDEFAPKSVVVDEDGQVLCASADMQKYLTVAGGRFHNNIIRMARSSLRLGLRTILKQAIETRRRAVHDNLSIRENGTSQRVMITVQPMPALGEATDLFMVVFSDVGLPVERDSSEAAVSSHATSESGFSMLQNSDAMIQQLEQELACVREDLEKSMQDMESANEELKSSNEELLSMNEELQSANEELQSAKEETQAGSNALAEANADLENLLRSTQIATIFLDEQQRIRNFTPAATEIYGLIRADIGRPLSHLMPLIRDMPPLPAVSDISDENPAEDTVVADNGKSFIRRVLPYRTPEGRHKGIVVTFTDVTELQASQQAIAAREQRLAALISSTAEGIYGIDHHGRCTFANAACVRLLGYDSAEQLLGQNVHQLFHHSRSDGSHYPLEDCLIDKACREGLELHVDDEVFWRADGTSFDVEYWSYPLVQDGHSRGCVVTFLDATERRRWQRDLTHRESHLRRVIDNTLGFVGILDVDGTLREANQTALTAAGVTRDDVIGKKFWDCVWWNYTPNSRDWIRSAVQRAATGEIVREDVVVRMVNNSRMIIDFMLTPAPDENGQIEYLIPSGIDITDRKRAEHTLRDSERRLGMALRAGGMAAWEWTPKKSFWTRELYELLQIPLEETPSPEVFFKRVHPEDVAEVKSVWQTAVDRREPYECEFRVSLPDGSWRWVVGVGEVEHDPSDGSLRMYGLNWDSTKDHQAAEALRESERVAQAANISKSQFLANMSHEIRTPMTAVLGYTDLLMAQEQDAQKVQHLQTIKRNGNFLLDIINDILDLSKIEASRMELNAEQFVLHDLIADVQSMMAIRAREKDLSFTVDYEGKIPRLIRSDSKRLKQILVNLTGNAVKFTHSGCVRLKVQYTPGDSPTVQFDIVDTGIGMSDEQQSRLFQPFSQGDSSVARIFGGTGLGLVISQRLAEMLGGSIHCRSEVGDGSTFSFRIPVGNVSDTEMVQPEQFSEVAADAVDGTAVKLGSHVLLVDDRRDVRFLTRHLLSRNGAHVSEAEDGEEAILAVQKILDKNAALDLVLLDMQMPRLDGYQTATRLRQMGFTGPIIALTADAMHGDMKRCLESGCDAYLSKPIDAEALIGLVKKFTGSSR